MSFLASSAMIASCGGGETDLLNGVFSDSPVGGIGYTTASVSGKTDAAGIFYYREGEVVLFSIGELTLPVAVASEKVTPLDMSSSGDVSDPFVVNTLRLLQSLDQDGNPANGITIPERASNTFTEPAIFDATDDSAVDAIIEQIYADTRQAVSADQAIAHFIETLSADADSDGMLDQLNYVVATDETFSGDSLFVDQNTFSLTLDGEVHTGVASINQGVYQLSGADEMWFVSVNDVEAGKLACIEKAPTSIAECSDGLHRVFAEEEQAMAYNVVADESTVAESLATETEDTSTDSNNSETASETTDAGLATGAATDAASEPNAEPVSVPDAEPVPELNAEPNSESQAEPFPELEAEPAPAPEVAPEPEAEIVSETIPGSASPLATTEPVTDSVEEAVEIPANPTTDELTLAELFPECDSATADPDGDGFGWENQTCLIVVDGVILAENLPAEIAPPVLAPTELETTDVEQTEPEPVVTESPETVEVPLVVEAPVEVTNPAAISASDITDIIVLTGQTNATGTETDFDPVLDTGHERLFAFNEDGQWQVADLDQYWDVNLPSNFASVADGREPYNNLAFQIGKSLTEQTDRVVGIIMLTAPGEGISHWDYNSDFYTKMRSKVVQALGRLPQKDSIDAMIWMQGESDWLAEGTADQGATGFASTDSDFYQNYYPNKLMQLVSNLRSEFWYGPDAQFICGETKKADLNPHLMALNNDGDDRTSCAQASDLPVRESDPFGNHFSAAGLRTLGDRMAMLYLSFTN